MKSNNNVDCLAAQVVNLPTNDNDTCSGSSFDENNRRAFEK